MLAATNFGTQLVVVLGHSQCGAILATLEYLQHGSPQDHSENSRSIVERIRPAVENLVEEHGRGDLASLGEAAVRANVEASVNQLKHGSGILEQLIDRNELRIVGAEYSLETGAVEFY